MLTISFDAAKNRAEIRNKLAGLDQPLNALKTWAVAARDRARDNARAKGGRSFWKREVAGSVQADVMGDHAEVYSTSRPGAFKETGGTIRPKNGKMLAVPTRDNPRPQKWPREYAEGELFLLKTPQRAMLARKAGRGGKDIKIMFVLLARVKQQPDPWWLTAPQVVSLGLREVNAWMKIEEEKRHAQT